MFIILLCVIDLAMQIDPMIRGKAASVTYHVAAIFVRPTEDFVPVKHTPFLVLGRYCREFSLPVFTLQDDRLITRKSILSLDFLTHNAIHTLASLLFRLFISKYKYTISVNDVLSVLKELA